MSWAPDYTTAERVRDYLEFNGSGNRDDDQIALAITSASRAVDKATNRQFGLVDAPEARVYLAQWDRAAGRWFVTIDDVMTTDGLVVMTDPMADESFTGEVGSAYALGPRNAAQKGRPYTRLDITSASTAILGGRERPVEVTARWGWTEVPAPIEQAVMLQASRLLWRRGAPAGVAGSPEAGSEIRLLARLDPDVLTSVRPFVRMWAVR